tara:strand:- start:148 stop:1410 length:1263 start_codon:yes stop_codon:yes gene_type:complete
MKIESLKFGDIARLRKNTVKPKEIDERKYLGLEHINKESLSINSIGSSCDLESNKYEFSKDDILFGKLRPYFRKVYKPKFDGICSTDIWVVQPKDKNTYKDFLFYLMADQKFIDFATQGATGTRMPRADWNNVVEFKVKNFTYNEQINISNILRGLDNKIELNQKMNQILEEIAKSLFKSWFIDYDPVRAKLEGRPSELSKEISDLFPDSFEDSELGEIPKGWSVKKITDIAEKISHKFKKNENWSQEKLIDLARMPINSISLNSFGKGEELSSSVCKFNKYDFLFGSIRPYFYKAGICPFDGVSNTSVFILRGINTFDREFMYFYCSSDNTFKKSIQYSEGTKMPVIKWNHFKKFCFALPGEELRKCFSKKTNNIVKKIISNTKEQEILINLRDELLPKLISGELRIPDAEKLVEGIGV